MSVSNCSRHPGCNSSSKSHATSLLVVTRSSLSVSRRSGVNPVEPGRVVVQNLPANFLRNTGKIPGNGGLGVVSGAPGTGRQAGRMGVVRLEHHIVGEQVEQSIHVLLVPERREHLTSEVLTRQGKALPAQ